MNNKGTKEKITSYIKSNPCATAKEIQYAVSVSSQSLVRYHLSRMEKLGEMQIVRKKVPIVFKTVKEYVFKT